MCCSWLRCRRRVADSTENNEPMEAFEKSETPAEEATEEEQKTKSRKACSYRTSIAFLHLITLRFLHIFGHFLFRLDLSITSV